MTKKTINLSGLKWSLSAFIPNEWRFLKSLEVGAKPTPELYDIPAPVPGSVQQALLQAGIIPDWNQGLNARLCEWVENRHWCYQTTLPDEWFVDGAAVGYRLCCLGLDYAGEVWLNGQQIGTFANSLVPHEFDLSMAIHPTGNRLHILFECPPRWLGMFGSTFLMREPKPRFNYSWDWTSRLVQIGIWDTITLEITSTATFAKRRIQSSYNPQTATGRLQIAGEINGAMEKGKVQLALTSATGETVRQVEVDLLQFRSGLSWANLKVEPWWPNGAGAQPLYTLRTTLLDAQASVLDETECQVGFKAITWRQNDGAPENADPWICVINEQPFFLQGVNWTPIRPNFADVTDADYRLRLQRYKEMGVNLLRVWGGAFLEKEIFYRECDRLGLLVWQEFPLSSSGTDNWPPEDAAYISSFERIVRSYIQRRAHHACLLMWCGGNELQGDLAGHKYGAGQPITLAHPLMKRVQEVVAELDPDHRFVPTSASGPRAWADAPDVGKGLHWDVHGPWKPEGTMADWATYWQRNDALFRSEAGSPGASPMDILEKYQGEYLAWPPTLANPLWRRSPWWVESEAFAREHGRGPVDLAEYVAWSQERQGEALVIAARSCKEQFPRCGGFLIWMGHDSFPCTANTSIFDFEGRPKPAAIRLAKEVFGTESLCNAKANLKVFNR